MSHASVPSCTLERVKRRSFYSTFAVAAWTTDRSGPGPVERAYSVVRNDNDPAPLATVRTVGRSLPATQHARLYAGLKSR